MPAPSPFMGSQCLVWQPLAERIHAFSLDVQAGSSLSVFGRLGGDSAHIKWNELHLLSKRNNKKSKSLPSSRNTINLKQTKRNMSNLKETLCSRFRGSNQTEFEAFWRFLSAFRFHPVDARLQQNGDISRSDPQELLLGVRYTSSDGLCFLYTVFIVYSFIRFS